MMAKRRWLVAVQAAAWLGMAYGVVLADDATGITGDLKKMQGTWTYSANDGGEGTWVFKGDVLTLTLPNRKYVIKLSLDEKAKPHPTIDFKIEEGPDDAQGQNSKGIYKLEGDSLTICVAGPNGERPKALEAVDMEAFLFSMKRKK